MDGRQSSIRKKEQKFVRHVKGFIIVPYHCSKTDKFHGARSLGWSQWLLIDNWLCLRALRQSMHQTADCFGVKILKQLQNLVHHKKFLRVFCNCTNVTQEPHYSIDILRTTGRMLWVLWVQDTFEEGSGLGRWTFADLNQKDLIDSTIFKAQPGFSGEKFGANLFSSCTSCCCFLFSSSECPFGSIQSVYISSIMRTTLSQWYDRDIDWLWQIRIAMFKVTT